MQQTPTALKHIHVNTLMLILPIIGIAIILGWLIKYSGYGLDFTDESYYISWIKNPYLYDWSLTQFGYIYHPLYTALDGSLENIRRVNIIGTFILAWIMVVYLLKSLLLKPSPSHFGLIVISGGIATASLIYFSFLPFTPSYNSLTLQSLFIASTGLLFTEKNTTIKSIIGWILLGIGGWLAFMAKPSTALALTVVVCLYIILAQKISIRMTLVAIISAFTPLIISAFLIDGSIYKFIDRIQIGVQFASYLDSGHTLNKIIRLDNFYISESDWIIILIFSAVSFSGAWLSYSEKITYNIFAFFISTAFLTVVSLYIFTSLTKPVVFGPFRGLIISAVLLCSIALFLIKFREKIFSSISRSQWAIALTFLVMPHVYAFGTNGNYWQSGSAAAIFWLLAGIVLLGPLAQARNGWSFIAPLTLATQAITVMLLQTGLENPYRQPQPLRLNNSIVNIAPAASKLTLSAGYARYLNDAMSASRNAGLVVGTPVIDLTGQSPGILFAIGAENIGKAWIIGGYPGSQKAAEASLERVSCDKLSIAWILRDEEGPRNVTSDVLFTYGANLLDDFERVTSWSTSAGAGGYTEPRHQVLYRPLHSDKILAMCLMLKLRKAN